MRPSRVGAAAHVAGAADPDMRRCALCLSLWLGLTHAHAQLFESQSERLGDGDVYVVGREVEM